MINHCRTLLLNARIEGPGAEYTTKTYKPKKLTKSLQAIWNTLFGNDVSDSAKNYRARQLMTILHGTELVKYIYERDPRITYWPITDNDCFGPEPPELIPIGKLVSELEHVLSDDLSFFYGSLRASLQPFETIWNKSRVYPERLSALLLAFIFKVEELDEVEGH